MKNKKTKLALIAKLFGGLCLVALLVFNLTSVVHNESPSKLSLYSVMNSAEAGTELGDWWDRKDYNCIPRKCYILFVYAYDAQQPEYAGEGKGTEAHQWNCAGC